jgi:hypothetical protein
MTATEQQDTFVLVEDTDEDRASRAFLDRALLLRELDTRLDGWLRREDRTDWEI